MSYPLARLPYGLRCRFRELATPLEAYDFGFAAPHFLGDKYTQKAIACDKVKVSRDEKLEPVALIEARNHPNSTTVLQELDLYRTSKVHLEGVTPQYMQHFDGHPVEFCVQLTWCHVSEAAMLRPWRGIREMCIEHCTFAEGYHVGDLCAVMRPYHLVLKDDQLDENWVDMFLEADAGRTYCMDIETASINVLNVDERTLWKLFEKQGLYDFTLMITVDADESLIAETLSRQFNDNFLRMGRGLLQSKTPYCHEGCLSEYF